MPVDQAARSAPAPDRTTSPLPPPVRAGIGLVAAGVDQAKRLPARVSLADVAGLPIRGLAYVAAAREAVERTYEELANRGETVVARWRHQPLPRQTAAAPPPAGAGVAAPIDLAGATPGATLAHDALPLDDYDHLTLGSLRARLPRLDAVALAQLLDYERVHANRLPVLTLLQNRLAKIRGTL
jgi:hypothetical protein